MQRRAIAMLVALLGLTWSGQTMGKGRDADGSRMQAREQKLGASATDRLAPPGDAVDWRYVRVTKDQDLEIRLTTKGDRAARVQVTNAVGKPIMEGATQKGQLTLTRRVDPGLYYFAVSATAPVEYSISVR